MAPKVELVSKKRKRDVVLHQDVEVPDTTKPSAVFKPAKGRKHTLSIALPGSIIANAQTHELQTVLAGQIARAAAVFCVDEIVVFNDGQSHSKPPASAAAARRQSREDNESPAHKHTGWSDPDFFLLQVLSYLETPAHLRKSLFPFHQNLRFAGNLPSLDMPHHMRAHEWCQYREGVALEQREGGLVDNDVSSNKKHKARSGDQAGNVTYVECGLPAAVKLSSEVPIPPKTRVTLKFDSDSAPDDLSEPQTAVPVAPSAPREEGGYYWGYSVRAASHLSSVFTECPFDDGYDVSIGTSERGRAVPDVIPSTMFKPKHAMPSSFQHLLIVFGGVAGLEVAAAADSDLSKKGISGTNVGDLFDAWVNLVPGQGSRTIRTEEAVWVGLTAFREYIANHGGKSW